MVVKDALVYPPEMSRQPNESVRNEISRLVIAKESLDKALKVLILPSA